MALISCPECGREISDKAAACPHCGAPLEKPAPDKSWLSLENIERMKKDHKEKKREAESGCFGMVFLLFAMVAILYFLGAL